MATVAATVANGGALMKPRLTEQIVDRDGRTVDRIEPQRAAAGDVQQTAAQLAEMMTNVVREGTGTAAALQGIDVAGKTGTAEKDPSRASAAVVHRASRRRDDPKIAIAVTVEGSIGVRRHGRRADRQGGHRAAAAGGGRLDRRAR